jgi:hypothetical protein
VKNTIFDEAIKMSIQEKTKKKEKYKNVLL